MRRVIFFVLFQYSVLPSAAQTELNPPEFSAPGAILSEPFKLNIIHNQFFLNPRSFVYYTLDNSDPTPENGTLFIWPFTINETTVVCAAAFMEGALPSPIVTHSYIFPADVIQQSPENLIAKGWLSDAGGEYVDLGLDSSIVKGRESQLIASAPSLSLVLPFDSLFD